MIKSPQYINIYTKNISKTTDIIHKAIAVVQESGPLWSFSLCFVGYFSIIIIKVNIFIISSNMFLHICNGTGFNIHAHTHFSKIIRSE